MTNCERCGKFISNDEGNRLTLNSDGIAPYYLTLCSTCAIGLEKYLKLVKS